MAAFTVSWQNLNYSIPPKGLNLKRQKPVQVLHNLNGQFQAGELIALMGPSGAGKTTLLECFVGKRVKGLTGRIRVTTAGPEFRAPLRIAIVPQQDHLFDVLTVRETLKFASRFRNPSIEQAGEHNTIVDNLLSSLSLTQLADSRLSNLSGGERKRVSVAQELVSKVDVLFVDEPTTGLDALSAYNLMAHLNGIVESLTARGQSVAMVTTIHQPPTRVFTLFKRIYFLSSSGTALYDGPPAEMMNHVMELDPSLIERISEADSHEEELNVADFMTEIAAGEHGRHILEAMEGHLRDQMQNSAEANREEDEDVEVPVRNDLLLNPMKTQNFWKTSITCFQRGWRLNLADRLILTLRILVHLAMAIFGRYSFYLENSQDWACPDWRRDKPMWSLSWASGELQELPDVGEALHHEAYQQQGLFGVYFFTVAMSTMFIFYSAGLLWPRELRITRYEIRNGWYSVTAYVLGRGLADLPTLVTLPFVCVYLTHYLVGGEITLYITLMLFIILAIYSLAMEASSQLLSILVPGGLNCVMFSLIVALQIVCLNEYMTRAEDIVSPIVRQVLRHSVNNVALRAIVSTLYSGEGAHCRCDWEVLDRDEPPPWMCCMNIPQEEIFYTDVCQGIGSNGTHWTLDGLFKKLTFSGKYDRALCPHHVDLYKPKMVPLRTFQAEYDVYVAQPRGPREFKPQIYHPVLMSMTGLDHGQLPELILLLVIYAIVFRTLSWAVLKLRK